MNHKGIWLPSEVIQDKNLTWLERVVLMEVNQLSELKKGCIAHNEHFSLLFNIKRESVSRVLSSLRDKGYINIDISNRNHNRVITINKMLLGGEQNVITPLTKCLESKENKTINNTIRELSTKINKESFLEWVGHKKLTEAKHKARITKCINFLSSYSKEEQKQIIDTSIMNEWKGLFPPKQQQKEEVKEWS